MTCPALLDAPGYCETHRDRQIVETALRNRFYDQHQRDPEAKKFYNSTAWINARNDVLADHPVCQRCTREFAAHVHHIKPLKECSDDEKLNRSNLLAVCQPCHNALEAEATPAEEVQPIVRPLVVVEDETFCFDPVKAERPIKFIEKHCLHYEGRLFAGKPFKLLDWQKNIIRTLFGWVRRDNGLRRFTELYLLTAKGAGKTPMLAALGLYMLLMDGEPGPHVISMAGTLEQANLTFGAGKNYIRQAPALQQHVDVVQYSITAKRGFGKWTTISGKPSGRSGPRPSCIIADEVHEWAPSATETFEMITANLFKRSQPLLMIATNAAKSRNCFAWTIHQRALKVLSGEIKDAGMLPVIYEAPKELPWDSEEAAAAANPSLGTIVKWSQLASTLAKAKESPAEEAKYRRLTLSQWVAGSEKWLRMQAWTAAETPFDAETLKHLPLYVGLDLAMVDDLCAAVFVWVSREQYYVKTRFWIPAITASHYQVKEGLPYDEWIESGDLIALEETTVTPEVLERIADEILEETSGHQLQVVAYDSYYAALTTKKLESKNVTCIGIRQGFSISPGCFELERRLKEGSITFHPNAVMKFCASNVEVQQDGHGNIWPRKPNANGKYAGKRGAKIDGIAALVTAMTEAKRQELNPEPAPWVGEMTPLDMDDNEC